MESQVRETGRGPLVFVLAGYIILGLFFTLSSFLLVRDVTILDEGRQIQVHTYAHRVEDVLREAGLTLHPQDQITPQPEEFLPRVATIEITRFYPVYLRVDNEEFDYWVTGGRVWNILRDTGIVLGNHDEISPSLWEKTTPHMTIEVTRIFKQAVSEEVVLSHREIRQQNPSMDRGFSRLISSGRDGLRRDTYETTYADGILLERELVESEILQARQDRIVEEGSNTLLAARGGQSVRFKRAMYVHATAYCPGTPGSGCPIDEHGRSACTGRHNTGYTATGYKAVAGTGSIDNPHVIAVDPRVIPLGSNVYIAGYGFATAQDTGGSIKGQRIDLLFDTHSEALRFGRRQLKLYLLP